MGMERQATVFGLPFFLDFTASHYPRAGPRSLKPPRNPLHELPHYLSPIVDRGPVVIIEHGRQCDGDHSRRILGATFRQHGRAIADHFTGIAGKTFRAALGALGRIRNIRQAQRGDLPDYSIKVSRHEAIARMAHAQKMISEAFPLPILNPGIVKPG